MIGYILVDAILLGVISFFALKGIRMGLVMSVASALALVIALFGAQYITGLAAPRVAVAFEPFVGDWVEGRAQFTQATPDVGLPDISLYEILRGLGFSERLAGDISGTVSTQIVRTGASIQQALAYSIALSIARLFTFTVSFLAIMLIVYFAAQLLDRLSKIPIANMLNKLGGLAGGAAAGGIIVYIAVTALSFLGVVGSEFSQRTYLLRMFVG